jgi:hypothetical protein
MKSRAGIWCAACCALTLAGGAASAQDATGQPAGPDVVPSQVNFAVDRGLAYLAKRQDRTGAFGSAQNEPLALTALSVMAFLARGHVPGQGPYGQQLNHAIDWVLLQQRPSGLFEAEATAGHRMYEHGLSTVMLCEVFAMVDPPRQAKVRRALAAALRVTLDAQKIPKGGNSAGGWRYSPTSTDSDISVSGWQLMALRGAGNLGAAVPEKALTDGVDYILHQALPSGGFGYLGPDVATPARTGTGVLALELLGEHNHAAAIAGGDYLLRERLNARRGPFFYYGAYYVSQASNQLGGHYWTGIYLPLRDVLLAEQRADGSWDGSDANEPFGTCYATSLALLALNVPWRYLPLYQR